jgi:hypothetical protein
MLGPGSAWRASVGVSTMRPCFFSTTETSRAQCDVKPTFPIGLSSWASSVRCARLTADRRRGPNAVALSCHHHCASGSARRAAVKAKVASLPRGNNRGSSTAVDGLFDPFPPSIECVLPSQILAQPLEKRMPHLRRRRFPRKRYTQTRRIGSGSCTS